jgi:hypothetical protein
MKLFQWLLGGIAFLFGLYYLQLLFFRLATQYRWSTPFFEALPVEAMIYFFIVLLLVIAGLTYLADEEQPLFPILFLLQIPWVIFFPLAFIPSIPLALLYVFLHRRQHPIRKDLPLLIGAYLIAFIAPSLSYLLLFIGWGAFSQKVFLTKKRSF